MKTAMLVLVDEEANSNKFYRIELDGAGQVKTTYGRVGADGVSNVEHTGLAGFEKILHAKKRKGYREVDVASDTVASAPRLANLHLTTVAKSGLTSGKARDNKVIDDLIERICAANAHDILENSGGLIKVDISGRVRTPLGLVTARSISEATVLLDRIEFLTGPPRTRLLEEYLTLVPQKVPSKAGWADTFFNAQNTVQKQRDFLGQLHDSVTFFDAQAIAAASAPVDAAADAGFKYKIRAVADGGTVFERVRKFYESSKNGMHQSSSLTIKHVYELVDPVGAKTYATVAAEIRNEQQMWHGTKAANLLSILRKGLFVPPSSGTSIQTTGRMFGDGIYLSNQSTKSLNYATGFWGGGKQSSTFMLMNDVAMGSEYRPTRPGFDRQIPIEARTGKNKFGKPFNSINVKAGTGGVRNHEAIVWNLDQIRVRYLVEFGA